MSARLVERSGARAVVLITPTWLGRCLGRRPYLLRCEKVMGSWYTEATGRSLSSSVLNALDREETADLPAATLLRRSDR